MNTNLGGPRAALFQRLLEMLRQARAHSSVILEGAARPNSALGDVEQAQGLCRVIESRVDVHGAEFGVELADLVRRFVGTLETYLSELVLGRLLGGDDESGRGALVRARRGLTQDVVRLEMSIRRLMAVSMAA